MQAAVKPLRLVTNQPPSELETLFQVLDGIDENLYSEIIILDEDEDPQAISERISRVSEKANIQAAQSIPDLQQASRIVVAHVNNYVDRAIANLPTTTPEFIPMLPPTLEPGTPAALPSDTSTPIPLTFTLTVTPSTTPSPTPTLQASVELVSGTYLTTGVGCQIDIVVRVTGSPATGSFHVWNASYGPNGKVDPMLTLPVGTYSGNSVTLSGDQPDSYVHEVWFEYDGKRSNRLMDLVCPLLPRGTPVP